MSTETTVRKEELAKYESAAKEWWTKRLGLLNMNSLRVPFICDGLLLSQDKKLEENHSKLLQGFRLLDVGCGGGFLSEPLAKLGAKVTGLDPSSESINVAKEHSTLDAGVKDNVTYVCDAIENFKNYSDKFDAVVCSEVIEHVNNVPYFVACCADLVKDGGSLFFTTINRTTVSYLTTIVIAEYIAGFIPKGSHNWYQYITPAELINLLESNDCHAVATRGMTYNPIWKSWSWSSSCQGFYALHALKKKD